MILEFVNVKCAVCGNESEQFCGSIAIEDNVCKTDFFCNPNIDEGTQYCPYCGYAHGRIDLIDSSLNDSRMFDRIKKLVDSEDYKNCDEQKEFLNNEWEEQNYKAFLVDRLM